MKLIIPMAGMGKRMRPHTLNTPKPLLKIAGKSLVQRIAEDLKNSTNHKLEEIHYIIAYFGKAVEKELLDIAADIGSKGFIHYQDVPLGTAHAIYCADDALQGEVIIAFADTLFEGDFKIERSDEGIIWTMRVDNPENYGVVVTDNEKRIKGFSEKPRSFVSDEAIIGIYFFRKAEVLKSKIELLFENKTMVKGEYQLTDALEMLLDDNIVLKSTNIHKWLDCGNKDEFLRSAKNILRKDKTDNSGVRNTKIIEPVYIGQNVSLENAVIGPFVIIEDNTEIIESKIDNSIIYADSRIEGSDTTNSIIGNCSVIKNAKGILNVGDYSTYEG